jgi:anti-sigma B factor antagonist
MRLSRGIAFGRISPTSIPPFLQECCFSGGANTFTLGARAPHLEPEIKSDILQFTTKESTPKSNNQDGRAMELETTDYKRCTLIKASGRVDGLTAPKLEEAFDQITNRGVYKIVLDMTDVDFMSSAGWWVLIEAQKKSKRYNRGEIVLVNVKDRIKSSLDLVGMGSYFNIYDDVTAAVAQF